MTDSVALCAFQSTYAFTELAACLVSLSGCYEAVCFPDGPD